MAFVTGLLLIDAPASALNNLGKSQDAGRDDNVTGVKLIKTREGVFPYVSAQAFRYWLRQTLEAKIPAWKAAPVYREEKVAYAEGDPITYWDDDLFGYMRAPSAKKSAGTKLKSAKGGEGETSKESILTRVSPFRVSTLVSIAPVTITMDKGFMSRMDEFPVPHNHEFYRTTLKGLFSLDLRSAGTFSYRSRTGFKNLDEIRVKLAAEKGLEHDEQAKSYRLSAAERATRTAALFEGLALLEGGAKQTLHYTDVMPALTLLAVTRGGNHLFHHVVGADARGLPVVKTDALEQALSIHADELLSPVYLGWVKGYQDEQRAAFEKAAAASPVLGRVQILHPREAFAAVAAGLRNPAHANWLS